MRVVLLADTRTETLLRGPLGDAGFLLEAVRTSDALAESCASKPPAVILASQLSPPDPFDFLKACRDEFKTGALPIVLLLPAGMEIDTAALIQTGAADVFFAPYQGAKLIRRLKDITTGRKSTQPPPVRPVPAVQEAPPEPDPATLEMPEEIEVSMETIAPRRPDLIETDIELPSLPGQQIDLSGIAPTNPGPVRRERKEGAVEASAPETVDRWPSEILPLEVCIELLVMEVTGRPIPPGTDETTLAVVWKSLTSSDVTALRSIADGSPNARARDLARMAAHRLRMRFALAQGDRLLAAGAKPPVNETFVRELKQQVDRDVRDILDPILQRAIEEGDLSRMKDYRATREAISLRLQELDRLARRLWGTNQIDVATHANPAVVRTGGTLKPKAYTTASGAVVFPVRQSRTPLVLTIIALVIAGGAAGGFFLHRHLQTPPQTTPAPVQYPTIAGVDRIGRAGTIVHVVVNSTFNREKGLRQLVSAMPPGVSLMVTTDRKVPVVTYSPAEVQSLAARIARGEAVQLAPLVGPPESKAGTP